METIQDTFWWLLEKTRRRELGDLRKKIDYATAAFSQETYQNSRKQAFRNREEAYADWMNYGKTNGLEFSSGKNTVLKIILKAKDETFFIDKWMEHHEKIVGPHNIVILDCGSEDPNYLAKLERYRESVVVFDYHGYYDDIHWIHANREFYDLISDNSKYIAVLDADEFLFGHEDGLVSGKLVLPILENHDHDIFCGTWYNSVTPLHEDENLSLDWSAPIRFDLSKHSIFHGSYSGKSIVKSSLCRSGQVKYIGHNVGTLGNVERLTPECFGKLGILHIKELDLDLVRKRVLKHLYAKKIIPRDIVDRKDVDARLRAKLLDDIQPIERKYIADYFGNTPKQAPDTYFESGLLSGTCTETQARLCQSILSFDFAEVIRKGRVRFE